MNDTETLENINIVEVADKPKILMVDDKPENLVALERLLRDLPVKLYKANSGNEALKLTLHHDFALALLDIQMPEMDGYELAEILRSEEKTVRMPFIFISAIYTDHTHIFKGYEKGAFSFITKPFEPPVLISKIEFFIEKHQQEQALKRTHKLLEQRVKERTAELERSNRELEQFAYLCAHNLKTPVLNVDALLSMVEQDKGIPETSRGILAKVKESNRRMRDTIETINEVIIAKNQAKIYPAEPIPLRQLINEVKQDLYMDLKEANATVKIDVAGCPEIKFPVVQLRNILQNLVSNSIKFRREEIPPVIKIISKRIHGKTCLSVSDNGSGIDLEAYGHKLFGLFQRFHLKKEGRGIGLHLIKYMVEQQGGKIEVKSKVGKGTTFLIYLP